MTDRILPTERQRFIDAALAVLDQYRQRVLSGEVTALAIAHACHNYSYGGTWERNRDQPGVGAVMRSSMVYLLHQSNTSLDRVSEEDAPDPPGDEPMGEVVRLRPVEEREP